MLALDLFATRHPEVDIHLYGERQAAAVRARPTTACRPPSSSTTSTTAASPASSLSATNVSLVPHEMLAAGCIPVVNDAEHNRIVLDNDARRLRAGDAVRARRQAVRARRSPLDQRQAAAEVVAASVQGATWDDAGDAVVRIVEDVVADAMRPRMLRAS